MPDSPKSAVRNDPRSNACDSLLQFASPDIYRRNAFRVLALRTTTSLRDATKELERRRMFAELGQLDVGTRGRIRLKPPPSIEELRAAEAALHDPEQRLMHELFWFWPLDSNSEDPDAALNALQLGDLKTATGYWEYAQKGSSATTSRAVIAKHNLAVRWHLYVLDLESRTKGWCWLDEQADTIRKAWGVALKYWNDCIRKDAIWNALSARTIAMNDERLSLDFVQNMRESADVALLKINSTLALRYAEVALESASNDHIALITASPLFAGNETVLDEYIIDPAKTRTRQSIDAAEKSRTTDPKSGAVQADSLIETISKYAPLLNSSDTIRSRPDVVDLYDEVAEQCVQSVLSFHAATDDSSTATATLERALPLARGEELRVKIAKNIAIGKTNIALAKMAVLLDPLAAVEESKASPKERLAVFLQTVEPMVSNVSAILAESAEIKAQTSDRLSRVLRRISVEAWNASKDEVSAFDALARAESYAVSVELKTKLADDRATLTRVFVEELTAVESSRIEKSPKERLADFIRTVEPAISRVTVALAKSDAIKTATRERLAEVLRDISVDAWNESKDDVTAFDALARAESYAVSVELKKKLSDDRATLTCAYADQRRALKAERNKKYGWGVGIAAVVAVVIALNLTDEPSGPSSAPSRPAQSPVASRTTGLGTVGAADSASGQTYRIPSYISSELERDGAAADAAKKEAARIGEQLQALDQQLQSRKRQASDADEAVESLGASIEHERSYVSQTDEAAILAFNEKVAQYNRLLKRDRQLMNQANELVDPYNALLEQVKAKEREADRLVDAYNAKLQQYGRR